jgi:hypothetical protein
VTKGLIVSGEFGDILVREKAGQALELGELLIADTPHGKMLLQVFDLVYGSQLAQQQLELLSGLKLEENLGLHFFDPAMRNYILARAKNLVSITGNASKVAKTLPSCFSEIKDVTASDVAFLSNKGPHPLFIGNLRSGSKIIDVPIYLDGLKALSHHVLIAGTTGRGKSVLMHTLLWHTLAEDYCGMLVLDPHDEYYGRTGRGLKDHPNARERAVYYTPRDPPAGARTLKINLSQLTPSHFRGVVDWSDPQRAALSAYHHRYGEDWIAAALRDEPVDGSFKEDTLGVVKRQLTHVLGLAVENTTIHCHGIFDTQAGQSTIPDIVTSLETGKTVIIDTSAFSGAQEILMGSIIATEVLERRRRGAVNAKEATVVSIVLEEAPRVLGKDVLEHGPNIFAIIAREGRKFKVGLTAITQLPSLIPRDILANMNTKIILGVELKPERQALIESAAQDLSADERTIASLDKGEAIVTSNFLPFATPVKIPAFEETVKSFSRPARSFAGMVP